MIWTPASSSGETDLGMASHFPISASSLLHTMYQIPIPQKVLTRSGLKQKVFGT
ncbi:hypothetical protein FOVG_19761 [Fusarium oxysporum f. sp. pisi HDV247]|uniref:Uncharacterized protein n=1 Tax=Fusarium oxysporum f. sp. pisi HDV247 TaxID=1080344 RepID=W9NL81_FUSOX|nr:hypothetical protein FOVG_19761 [Fusarium oxysporum f. sp. pisi HDV247]